jgi:lipopolysaccharide transport system permease protein
VVPGLPRTLSEHLPVDSAGKTILPDAKSFTSHMQAVSEALKLFHRHRRLTWELAKSDISERYAGQVFGASWAVIHPLIQIGIYLFIFGFVFRVALGNATSFPRDYATYILAGLVPWIALQDSLNRSTTAIIANISLVRQLVFPIEILPVKGVLVSALSFCVSLFILTIYILLRHHALPWTYLLLPFLLVAQIAVMIGLSLVLSAAGAYFRDLKDIVQITVLCGMYASPVFYLPENVPSIFQPLVYANPFSYMIWCYQDAIYFGELRHPLAWPIFGALAFCSLSIGFRSFRRAKLFIGNIV